jgi:hypothetical protein
MDPIAKRMPEVYPLDADLDDDLGEMPVIVKKPVAKKNRDERRSRRCPVPPDRQACELKIGSALLSAYLLNESEGGFCVVIDRLEELKTGDKVTIQTDAGTFTVRIVHIQQIVPPDGAPADSDSWFRLGVKKASRFSFF